MHERGFRGQSFAKQPMRFGSAVVLNYGKLQVAFCGLLCRVGISIFTSHHLLGDALGPPGQLHSWAREADSPSPGFPSGAGPAARADHLPRVVWARSPGVDTPHLKSLAALCLLVPQGPVTALCHTCSVCSL